MYKDSSRFGWRSAILAFAVCAVSAIAVSCGEDNKTDEPEPVEERIEFSTASVSIPIDGTGTVSLKVTPVEKTSEVEVSVADEEVVEVSPKTDAQGYPVFRNGTPISAVSRDDAEEFGDFGFLFCVEQHRFVPAVVRVDVVDLVDFLRQKARPVQGYL